MSEILGLTKIEIKHSLSFENISLTINHLNEDPNKCRLAVIVGANGSGKSNLVRSYNKFFTSSLPNFKDDESLSSTRIRFSFTDNHFAQLDNNIITTHNQNNCTEFNTNAKPYGFNFCSLTLHHELNMCKQKNSEAFKNIDNALYEWSGYRIKMKNNLGIAIVYFEKGEVKGEEIDCLSVEGAIEDLLWFLLSIYSNHKTIFLDEPDKTFHPNFVRKMLGEISKLNNDISVVLISHSAEIVDWCHPKNIYKCVKTEGKTQFISIDEDCTKLPFISELFFAERVIMVEGITDYTILKFLKKHIECTTDTERFKNFMYSTLLYFSGKNSAAKYVKVCKKLKVNYKIILDRDAFFQSAVKSLDNKFEQASLKEVIGISRGNLNLKIADLKKHFYEGESLDLNKKIQINGEKLLSISEMLEMFKDKKSNESVTNYSNVKESVIGKILTSQNKYDKKFDKLQISQDSYGKDDITDGNKKLITELANECEKERIFAWSLIHDIEDFVRHVDLFSKQREMKNSNISQTQTGNIVDSFDTNIEKKETKLTKSQFKLNYWKDCTHEQYFKLVEEILKVNATESIEDSSAIDSEEFQTTEEKKNIITETKRLFKFLNEK